MELNYNYAESTVEPATLEITKNTVYLRKDIASINRTFESDNETTYYTYQEATLTPQEFNEYSKLVTTENAIKGTNDSENIALIKANQEVTDTNQLTVMEAIADLYELLLS